MELIFHQGVQFARIIDFMFKPLLRCKLHLFVHHSIIVLVVFVYQYQLSAEASTRVFQIHIDSMIWMPMPSFTHHIARVQPLGDSWWFSCFILAIFVA